MAEKNLSRLIPIKRVVADISKGVLSRTYYYKPNTLLKEIQKKSFIPAVNHFANSSIIKYYDNKNPENSLIKISTLFKKYPETWKVVSLYNIKKHYEKNKLHKQSYVYPLVSFLLSGDDRFYSSYRNKLKKSIIDYNNKVIITKNNIKNKKQKVYDIVKVACLVSNLINYYNPGTSKLEVIFKKSAPNGFDSNLVINHCVFSEKIILKAPESCLNVLVNNINLFFSENFDNKKNKLFLEKYVKYYFYEIYNLNKDLYNQLIYTYSFSDICKEVEDFIKFRRINSLIDDAIDAFYCVIFSNDKNEQLLRATILSEKLNFLKDQQVLRYISLSDKIYFNFFDFITYSFLRKYNVLNKQYVKESFTSMFVYQKPSLVANIILLLLNKLYNKFYMPYLRELFTLNPEIGSVLYLLSKSKICLKELYDKIIKNNFFTQKTVGYIPVKIKDNNEQKRVILTYRLNNFHIVYLDKSLIENNFCYIKVDIDRYIKLDNSTVIALF